MYGLLRPLLFTLDPESAHERTAALCRAAASTAAGRATLEVALGYRSERLATTVCGVRFPNPVGMAAGFDKGGDLYPFLAHAGFGFVESGTFTAVEQAGNPRPRVVRLPRHEALINRMGFNNPGALAAARRIAAQEHIVPRGISIGKSRSAPLERAVEDQMAALVELAPYADYVALNVSSPNTPGLRLQQEGERLRELLRAGRSVLASRVPERHVPLFVKLAPDLAEGQLEALVDAGRAAGMDGVILTNTTLDRRAVPEAADVEGGLSGAPLRQRSTELVRRCRQATGGELPIIGVGGIFSGADALEKILAGASLIQVYTGYVYRGPGLPRAINRYLDHAARARGVELRELVGSLPQG